MLCWIVSKFQTLYQLGKKAKGGLLTAAGMGVLSAQGCQVMQVDCVVNFRKSTAVKLPHSRKTRLQVLGQKLSS